MAPGREDALAWGQAQLPSLLDAGRRQPDSYSCGAQSVVMARLLIAPPATDVTAAGLSDLVRATHRRLVALRGPHGLQLPWLRQLGTPPWAVAREMRRLTGVAHRVGWVAPRSRDQRWEELTSSVSAGRTVPIFIGSRLLPRHVVLAVAHWENSLVLHDPASGRLVALDQDSWTRGDRVTARWHTSWWVVLPTTR